MLDFSFISSRVHKTSQEFAESLLVAPRASTAFRRQLKQNISEAIFDFGPSFTGCLYLMSKTITNYFVLIVLMFKWFRWNQKHQVYHDFHAFLWDDQQWLWHHQTSQRFKKSNPCPCAFVLKALERKFKSAPYSPGSLTNGQKQWSCP